MTAFLWLLVTYAVMQVAMVSVLIAVLQGRR